MTPDLALIAGATAAAGVAISMLTQWRRNVRREAASARETLELWRKECSERFEELRKADETLEASFRSTRDVLRNGRLNGSTRTTALQLLRTGMSPDAAASSLGVAKREMQMIARVFELLSANSGGRIPD
jgi:transposase-like protein